MPSKTPLLQKKHYSILLLITFIAGLLGSSPYLYRKLSTTDVLSGTVPNQSLHRSELSNAPYVYLMPFVVHIPTYYMPMVGTIYHYTIQSGTPIYLSNFAHPEDGCNWSGIAGQVFSTTGTPLNDYTVYVGGMLNGAGVSFTATSGYAKAYGPGGYEIQLASNPVSSTGSLTAYLVDANLKPISQPVSLTTYADCQANLLLLNFSKIQ